MIALLHGSLAGLARLRFRLLHLGKLESGHREIRRAAGDLRHAAHLFHRHADRRSHQPRHRDLSHRDLSRAPAADHRHRHRAAGRHSEHHLRHLGLVRVRALVPGARAAVPDRYLRQHSRTQPAVRRSALRHRHADGRAHPCHHGAAVHHLDHARGVRDRPAGAERGRLRHRLHPLGGDAPRGDPLYAGRHYRRRHAGAWAARSARPWR